MLYQNTKPLTLADQITEAETLLANLDAASKWLQQATGNVAAAYAALRTVEQSYTDAENEYSGEAVVQAVADKSGPLGGIATTSKAYDIALGALRAKLRNEDLADMAADLDARRTQYEAAQAEQRQAETEFSAARHAADLRAAMLRAASS